MKNKRLALLLFICALLPVLTGGKTRPSPETDYNELFDAFCARAFADIAAANTLDLHSVVQDPAAWGIEEGAPSIGLFAPDDIAEMMANDKKILAGLLAIDYGSLTPERQKEYDILNAYYSAGTDEAFFLYDNPLAFSGNLVPSLPFILAEFDFNTREDIDVYLLLLKDIPRAFDDIALYFRAQSEAGLFMSDNAADEALAMLDGFATPPGQNVLVTSFNERVNAFKNLTGKERGQYKKENLAIVRTQVYGAYETLADTVAALKDAAINNKDDITLSERRNGKQCYEQVIRMNTGLEESIDEIEAKTDEAIAGLTEALAKLRDENPGLDERFANIQIDGESPEAILEALRRKSAEDFPALRYITYQVSRVPKSLEPFAPPAFYVMPPVDGGGADAIYINEPENEGLYLFSTLAHEGFPGHMYQVQYSRNKIPPLRYALDFSGYDEGWATYVEYMSYGWMPYAETDPAAVECLMLEEKLFDAYLAKLDIGINYKGWTPEQILEEAEITDAMYADYLPQFYTMLTQSPGYGVIYFQHLKRWKN